MGGAVTEWLWLVGVWEKRRESSTWHFGATGQEEKWRRQMIKEPHSDSWSSIMHLCVVFFSSLLVLVVWCRLEFGWVWISTVNSLSPSLQPQPESTHTLAQANPINSTNRSKTPFQYNRHTHTQICVYINVSLLEREACICLTDWLTDWLDECERSAFSSRTN